MGSLADAYDICRETLRELLAPIEEDRKNHQSQLVQLVVQRDALAKARLTLLDDLNAKVKQLHETLDLVEQEKITRKHLCALNIKKTHCLYVVIKNCTKENDRKLKNAITEGKSSMTLTSSTIEFVQTLLQVTIATNVTSAKSLAGKG